MKNIISTFLMYASYFVKNLNAAGCCCTYYCTMYGPKVWATFATTGFQSWIGVFTRPNFQSICKPSPWQKFILERALFSMSSQYTVMRKVHSFVFRIGHDSWFMMYGKRFKSCTVTLSDVTHDPYEGQPGGRKDPRKNRSVAKKNSNRHTRRWRYGDADHPPN